MLRSVKVLKTDSKEVEGGRRMRRSDGKLCLSDKKEVKSGRVIWKGSRM